MKLHLVSGMFCCLILELPQGHGQTNQTYEDFSYGLDSILMDSIKTPELDASFGGTNAVHCHSLVDSYSQ